MKEMDRYHPAIDREMLDRYQQINVMQEQKDAWIENRICDILTDLWRDAEDLHWYYDRPGNVLVRTDLACWVVGEQREDLCKQLGACDKHQRDLVWKAYADERAESEAESRDWS